MPESSFDIDRLGMLTLQHFEHSVESDSSCGENNYSSSELRSNASSPSYFSSGSESPVCSPTELNFPTQRDEFWDHKGGKEVAIPSGQQPTCRYRRGRRGKETVSKRNERERRRVRLISEGFCELRKHLMIQPYNRKLPKLQILRKAILYIKNLQDMIKESDFQNAPAGNPLTTCPRAPTDTQMAHLHGSSCINNRPRNMHTTYVGITALQRRDIHHCDPQPWL